jgi:phosphate transport system substrate-binding protein
MIKENFIEPSVASAKDKTYPIAEPLFYMFDKKNAAKVKTVVDYALSPEGQKIVGEVGYIPLD